MLRRDFFTSLASLGAMLKLPIAIARPAQRVAAPTGTPALAAPAVASTVVVAAAPAAAQDTRRTIPLQRSAVAGFQFHQGEQVWPALTIGAPLTLTREPENRFDPLAIRVEWNGQKIGYAPRAANEIAAGLMDRGETLSASIVALTKDDNPWERISMEIRLAA